MSERNIQLAKSIRNSMVADRETFDQAMEYAYSIARASDDRVAVLTAVQVVLNTVSKLMLENEQVSA